MSAQSAFAQIVGKLMIGVNLFVEAQAATAQQLVDTPSPPPSRGGEPPHKVTGNLQVHIHAIPAVLEEGAIIAGMGVPMEQVPYARRLELGFVGTDSKGRHYNDPPRPYLRPAAHTVAERVGEFFTV